MDGDEISQRAVSEALDFRARFFALCRWAPCAPVGPRFPLLFQYPWIKLKSTIIDVTDEAEAHGSNTNGYSNNFEPFSILMLMSLPTIKAICKTPFHFPPKKSNVGEEYPLTFTCWRHACLKVLGKSQSCHSSMPLSANVTLGKGKCVL